MAPSFGKMPFTGKPAFCHMKVRASQITPTEISPDLNAGASASVSGYSRSPLAFSFSMNAFALSKSVVVPDSYRLAAIITHGATVDHADLALPLRIEQIVEAVRRLGDLVRVVHQHLRAVDVRHEAGHRRFGRHVLQVGHLFLGQVLHQSGLVTR